MVQQVVVVACRDSPRRSTPTGAAWGPRVGSNAVRASGLTRARARSPFGLARRPILRARSNAVCRGHRGDGVVDPCPRRPRLPRRAHRRARPPLRRRVPRKPRSATPTGSRRQARWPRSGPSATPYDNAQTETLIGLYKIECATRARGAALMTSSWPPCPGYIGSTTTACTVHCATAHRWTIYYRQNISRQQPLRG